MSPQIAVRGSRGSTLPCGVAPSARSTRLRGVVMKATSRRSESAEPFGSQVLKGLQALGGTISLKPNKQGGTIWQTLTGSIGKPAPKQVPDAKTVFVAGATGRTGARVVRELLQAGFKVRAGVRNVEEAEASVQVAEAYGLLSAQDIKNLQIVKYDLSKSDSIKAAIGNARKVVCALGASESAPFDFSAPKKVDGDYTTALINAAAAQGVEQFVMVSSLGTGKVGWPASILNLFGGVLYWKREAEKALEGSGMAYTIVRPGGMERPTDSYKKTHNMVIAPRDTTFGGQVSRLQVAELIGSILLTPELAQNKVLEVTAATTAPRMTYQELLESVNADLTREQQLELASRTEEARSKVSAAEEKVSAAKAALAAADNRLKDLQERLKTVKSNDAEVKAQVAPVLKEGASAEKALETAKANLDKALLRESAARAVLDAARKAGSQGTLLDKKQLAAVADEVLNPRPAAKTEQPALAAVGAPAFAAFLGGAAKQQEGTTKVTAAPAAGTSKVAAKAVAAPAKEAAAAAPEVAERAKSPSFNLGSLFGVPEVVQVEEGTKNVKVPPRDASPAPAKPAAAQPKVAAATPAPAAAQPKVAASTPAPAAAKPKVVATPAPSPPSQTKEEQQDFLGNLASFFKPVITEEDRASRTPEPAAAQQEKKAEPVAAAAAAPAAPKPAAVQAPAPQKQAEPVVEKKVEKKAEPAPAPVAAAKPAPPKPAAPSVPVEDPAEVERRALAALADEKKAKALAEAKARLAKEAAALEESKALAAKATTQKAPSAEAATTAAPAAPKETAKETVKAAVEPKAAPKVAPKKVATGPSDAEIAAEKAKVQAWIAAWQSKQKAAPEHASPAAPVAVKPAAEKKTVSYDAEAAAKAKAEAQQWIKNWQTKQAAANKTSGYDAEAAAKAKAEAQQWIKNWQSK